MGSFILSQRGKEKFIHEGYSYIFDKTSVDGVTQFRCCERRRECKARTEADRVITKIKCHAAETVEATSQLINECVVNISEACQISLPTHDVLRKLYLVEKNLELLRDSRAWFGDGTFKIAPPLFSQVYVILGEKHDGVHPMVYTLLPSKSRATYDKLFGIIKDLQQGLQPATISCDFEMAAFRSMREHFLHDRIQGCFFHLTHNMKKHLCSMGLIHRLNRRRNGRRPPIFPHEMWNLYKHVLNGEIWTNNFAEAAHRRLQAELGMDHPSIWKFIDGLRKVQHGRDFYYE
ncbi:hypothetical protein J437_LFUL018501, partial [Ladona fulva]